MKKIYFTLLVLALVLAPFVVFGQSYTLGDTNHSGGIDIVDALIVAQEYVGLNPPNYYASEANVNCSEGIDIVDALLIARFYVGLIASFPCQSTGQTTTTTSIGAGETVPPVSSPTPIPVTPTVDPTGNPGDLNITINSGTPGAVKITGSSANGIIGSPNLRLLRITFNATNAGSDPENGYFGLTVDNLLDINGNIIGTGHSSLGLTVKIYSGTTTTSMATTTIPPLTTTSLPPGSGNAWLTPPGCLGIGYCIEYYTGMYAKVGDSFSLDLHVNTGNTNLGRAEFTITYPNNTVSFVSVGIMP